MKRVSYLETCHPRNLLSGIHAFVLRLDSRLRGNDSEVVSLHASRFTRCVCFVVLLFSFYASLFTLHAQAQLENGMSANIVIGQPNLTSNAANNGGRSARSISNPKHLTRDGNRLVLAEESNNRVLIFNQVPQKNFSEADVVLGQANFQAFVDGTTNAVTFDAANGVWLVGDRLFIAEVTGNRGLIYNTIPQSSGVAGDVVIGQDNFTSRTHEKAPLTTENPRGIFSDGKSIVFSNDLDHSVHIFHFIPTTNNVNSSIKLTRTMPWGRGLNRPRFAMSDGKHFVIADRNNNRVLLWHKAYPSSAVDPPDVVIGQVDFNQNSANQGGAVGPNTLRSPRYVYIDQKRLYIADSTNSRVLIFSEIPTENNASADIVIGQPDFKTSGCNQGGSVTGHTLCTSGSVIFDGRKLFVSDSGNNRVLIYNITDDAFSDLGPQFSQGKAVVGKVFWDWNGSGRQDHYGTPSQELRRARPASQARRQDA